MIKIGGNVLPHREAFCDDVKALWQAGIFTVIVHGGGKSVTDMEKTLGREASFVQGLRVTDAAALELVQMVLAGKVNSDLVAMFQGHGIDAIGLTGADGQLLLAGPRQKPAGLGYVGEVKKVNLDVFVVVADAQMVPVIAPLGITEDGQLSQHQCRYRRGRYRPGFSGRAFHAAHRRAGRARQEWRGDPHTLRR